MAQALLSLSLTRRTCLVSSNQQLLTQQYSCQKSKKNCIKPETFSWTTKRKCFLTSKQTRAKKRWSPFTPSPLKVRSVSLTLSWRRACCVRDTKHPSCFTGRVSPSASSAVFRHLVMRPSQDTCSSINASRSSWRKAAKFIAADFPPRRFMGKQKNPLFRALFQSIRSTCWTASFCTKRREQRLSTPGHCNL